MQQSSSLSIANRKNAALTILKAGLIAGILDATAASINYKIATGNNPIKVWKFVASGFFGKAALTGGTSFAIWGFIFHMLIAATFAALFFFIYPHVKFLSKNKVLTGLFYGIIVWMIMNLIIVPLSHTPKFPFNATKAILAAGILMVCIGLPISLIVAKYYSFVSDTHKRE